MLYLHLMLRHCTLDDVDPIPRIHILRFFIVSLVVHVVFELKQTLNQAVYGAPNIRQQSGNELAGGSGCPLVLLHPS